MSDPVLSVRGLKKVYGDHVALDGVDLDVHAGEVVAVIGPSGSGKSTLARCVHQLETIDDGAMYLDGELLGHVRSGDRLRTLPEKAIAAQRRRMGMVFQQFNLFPHRTVLQNVTDPPMLVHRTSKIDAERRATELLEKMGLAEKLAAFPRQLSGGQQQRVAIARAMATRPRIMLFDEPTSALDPELVDEVLRVIRDLATAGLTMLLVTHEMAFARDVADRVVFMAAGRVVETGPAATLFDAPQTPRLREFLARYTAGAAK
ncbi:amino acid ABC transporter ATP-binding protein [Cryptosporangium phraense]|uniref:Amino acid ABC transporter ATP-binding protein n=1 Tax=Cryptosporangium phraense TaxID=2593070 RepID=A0A545AMX5_9ACTN|nr:amino acid ABC transporter ATP-binding protein [Cryptosporangium phraense]TQS42095.1 amino acid ABC transporter ATP-binding protein [Cryptosporangium phraense]